VCTARYAPLILVLLLSAGPPTALGDDAAAAPSAGDFFETNIRPLLARRCYECHGPEQPEAGLRLDQPQLIVQGGRSGPPLIPGKPDESLLIQAVRGTSDALQMPPDEELPAAEVALLERWIRDGAIQPTTTTAQIRPAGKINLEREREFWAFQPPADKKPPAVRDVSWPRTPVDFFILAALEQRGLKPAPPADKRTLIRRATFDLTGLPPTPAEIEAFVLDDAPDAFAKVVDRLLGSPRYGERWARHWLDIARYADSNGLDENVAYGNAWRYRDYVIAAFNKDKPYDQFLVEQLAGDLLSTDDPQLRNERLIATGFLALGPKALAEGDQQKLEMDLIDEQVDTVGRALLGLTLGCARCHDHKYDPIATEDYYALAGIFKSTRTMESLARIARWHEHPLHADEYVEAKAKHDLVLAEKKAVIQRRLHEAQAAAVANMGAAGQQREIAESELPAAAQADLKQQREEVARLEAAAPIQPAAMGVGAGPVTDLQVHVRGDHLLLGATVPRGVPRILLTSAPPAFPADQSGRLELARWLTQRDHPLTSRVLVNRLWHWHFGQALCRTPDNFGQRGERPTHPALLDWLAVRLVRDGWSIKGMHRLLMLSSTYQMSSRYEPAHAEKDPENRLWWRVNVRRLDAEAIRDAILASSGILDESMGGSLLHVKNREFLFDHTSRDTTSYDSTRRSIYLPVIRNHLYDFYQLFDYSDASLPVGDRPTTTTAPQSLFFVNSDLVLQASTALATESFADSPQVDGQRLAVAYERVLGRPCTEKEVAQATSFIEAFAADFGADAVEGRRQAWVAFCQTLFCSNEFVYLR